MESTLDLPRGGSIFFVVDLLSSSPDPLGEQEKRKGATLHEEAVYKRCTCGQVRGEGEPEAQQGESASRAAWRGVGV